MKLTDITNSALGCVFGTLFVVAGFARLFAICEFVQWWLGAPYWLAAVLGALLMDVPIVGHALAFAGGVRCYGLRWYWSACIFAPEIVGGILTLCGFLLFLPFALLAGYFRPTPATKLPPDALESWFETADRAERDEGRGGAC